MSLNPALDTTTEDIPSMRVQCANSNDFVVGKQTNFNGPVTIINCPVPEVQTNESVIIRDQIWTEKASNELKAKALNPYVNRDTNQSEKDKNPLSSDTKKHGLITKVQDLTKVRFIGCPVLILIFLFLLTLAGLIAIIIQLTASESSVESMETGTEKSLNYVGNMSHVFVSRSDWGALNASSKLGITEPVPFVVITHTAGSFCYETKECSRIVREIQKMHLAMEFADLSPNFLVGGDGYIYEGRGWGIRNTHGSFVNNQNIDICFIGDFSVYDIPTNAQVDGVIQLLERGVEDCHLDPNYTLIAHNQTVSTLSPGRKVYEIISQWDHFSKDPPKNLAVPPKPSAEARRYGLESSCKMKPKDTSEDDQIGVQN